MSMEELLIQGLNLTCKFNKVISMNFSKPNLIEVTFVSNNDARWCVEYSIERVGSLYIKYINWILSLETNARYSKLDYEQDALVKTLKGLI